jgi:spore maturation protein CgeB
MTRRFHDNRVPVISEIQKEFKVRVISKEGLTKDQKWLYFASPISLSISLPVPGYTSNRLYNILSSEGFALVNWFPGISELFENEKHLVWFKSPEEARELVRFYLDRPYERDRIREEGHRLYVEKHTGAARIDAMLEKV